MKQLKKWIPLLLMLFVVQHAWAQTDTQITKEQQLKLDGYMKTLDSKIIEAFKKAPTVKTEMESNLKAIADMKDSLTLIKMIAAYQSKYSSTYSKILMAAGITKQMIIADLQGILPQFNFTVDSLLNIKGQSSGTAKILSTTANTTSYRKILLFDLTKTVSCGGFAGGSVTRGSNYVESKSTAVAVAGGCDCDGTLTSEFVMPTFQMATLIYRFKLHASGVAVGIVGTAGVQSNASAHFYSVDGTTNTPIIDSYYASNFSFAPFLWVTSGTQEQDVSTKTIALPSNLKKISVRYHASTFALVGLCCGTSGKAKVSSIVSNINLTYESKINYDPNWVDLNRFKF